MTGEDLGYKPGVVEKAKFEYSTLGKVFNKELDKKEEKEGLLKRLKNIEGKNEEQLKVIKDQGRKQLDAIEKQGENKLKIIEKDKKIVYLREGIDKLFEIYPKSFHDRSKILLSKLAKDENKTNYKDLSCKSTLLKKIVLDFMKFIF